MAYKRRPSWNNPFGYSSKTKISITWSLKSDAYAIKFMDTKNWNLMQTLMSYMKQQPYGEYLYDDTNKVWYLVEKHIEGFKALCETLKEYFEVDFVKKQEQSNFNQVTTIPIQVWQEKYKKLTNLNTLDKKSYLRWMMKNHPDVGGNSNLVSQVNECWNEMNKKDIVYEKEPVNA